MHRILLLHLRRCWWDSIAAGEKRIEYRRCGDYWDRQLARRRYDYVDLACGYPRRGDRSRVLRFRWSGARRIRLGRRRFWAIRLRP